MRGFQKFINALTAYVARGRRHYSSDYNRVSQSNSTENYYTYILYRTEVHSTFVGRTLSIDMTDTLRELLGRAEKSRWDRAR